MRLEGRVIVAVADDLLHRPLDAQRRLPAIVEYDVIATLEQETCDGRADKAGTADQENAHTGLQSW